MSAKPYVKVAERAVAALRRRALMLEPTFDPEQAIDVAEIASVVCDCEIVYVSQLSETRIFSVLESDYGVDLRDAPPPNDLPLAGALCVATNGLFRWLFVREEDVEERKRFTIAHELGHLFLEVMPELERAAATIDPHPVWSSTPIELRIFSRCSDTESIPDAARSETRPALSPSALREIKAHHFAAEVLMPYQGVRQTVARHAGVGGVRTQSDLDRLVKIVAQQYSVSKAAARLRLVKDLSIVPMQQDANQDLFG